MAPSLWDLHKSVLVPVNALEYSNVHLYYTAFPVAVNCFFGLAAGSQEVEQVTVADAHAAEAGRTGGGLGLLGLASGGGAQIV